MRKKTDQVKKTVGEDRSSQKNSWRRQTKSKKQLEKIDKVKQIS